MTFIHDIAQRLRRDYFRWHHARTVRNVLATPPLAKGTLPFTLLSMVQKRDVLPYLVAVKSFAHFLNPRRIVVVCDPSIDAADRAVFQAHVPHIELRQADEFTHAQIPRGGTWERLYAISGYCTDDYVVQLDADTVSTRPMPEVEAAVRGQYGFVIVEKVSTTVRSLAETRDAALAWAAEFPHIQNSAESTMATVGLPDDAGYVRGCSGFTGFPPNPAMRAQMLDYSARMTQALGERWTHWGTEQVTSNYLVANSRGVVMLPFPKYSTPDEANHDTAFCHYIGSLRFIDSKYARASAQMIGRIGRIGQTA